MTRNMTLRTEPVVVSFRVNGVAHSPASLGLGLPGIALAVATIGYAIWAPYGSGSRVAEMTIQRSQTLQLGGSSLTQSGARRDRVEPGPLEPAMNPARAILRLEHGRLGPMDRIDGTVTMRDADGHVVWIADATLRGGSDSEAGGTTTTLTVLRTFEVPASGRYTFDVSFPHGGGLVRGASLEVRRNVIDASGTVLLIGAFAAIAVFGAAVAAYRRRIAEPPAQELAA